MVKAIVRETDKERSDRLQKFSDHMIKNPCCRGLDDFQKCRWANFPAVSDMETFNKNEYMKGYLEGIGRYLLTEDLSLEDAIASLKLGFSGYEF